MKTADSAAVRHAVLLQPRTRGPDPGLRHRARRRHGGLLDLRTGPGDAGDPDHPGDPRLPRRPPRTAQGRGPAARRCGSSCRTSPASAARMPSPSAATFRGALRQVHHATSWRPWASARTPCCWAIRSAPSLPRTSWQPTRARCSPLILINPIAAPALEGPKGIMTKLAVLYYRLAARLPRRLGLALLRSPLIVRVMSEAMAKTPDKELRRFIHGQHHAYFSAFADRDSLLESFTASVSGNVAEVAGRAGPAGPADRRRKGRDRRCCPTSTASPPCCRTATLQGDSRRRASDPLRNTGTRRRLHPQLP